ncbi:hypothetical protein DN752_18810 [Echinicola strongylocentroti]|uniref:Uncharacterized protein n=1 Tax=Echinicola strongylocentroti TaxID=1795355 RepID=A0A2Z4IMQ4_9BACT|nr:hypothetical protein [Echinicola strongylocentroti]AWW32020.1 hypothetical protein DN752_18810 [Echinicola strongylocentroti]
MNKISLIVGLALFLFVAACDEGNNNTDQAYESPNTVAPGPKTIDMDPFQVTYEDIEEENMKLGDDLNKLKAEKSERALGNEGAEFDQLVSQAEEKVNDLEKKAEEFQSAAEEEQKEIYDEIKEMKKQVEDKMDEIENRFDKNNS